MSDVYADIATLIEDEKREVVTQVQAADVALAAAEEQHAQTVDPLQKRLVDLNTLEDQVKALAAEAAAPTPLPADEGGPVDDHAPDPSTPTAPAESADPSDSTSSPATPSPEEPSSPVESSPTAPSDSPTTEPVAQDIPLDAIALADVPAAIDEGVPDDLPVAVPTATGEVAVVTIADVAVASDPSVADDDLTDEQRIVRSNSTTP